jgi:hypothetical protein
MDKKYKSIYSKNGLEVFVNPEDYWADYKVRLNGYHAKTFYGETAWMDVTRFVHDQAMEFYDFDVDGIHRQWKTDLIEEIEKRFTDAGL